MRKHKSLLIWAGLGTLLLGAFQAQADSTATVNDAVLEVSGAYVRAPIPGRSMSAAFMTLTNHTANDQVMISARAAWASSIEIHTHTHDNGVMRMRQIPELSIPAGEQVVLKPGGLHLMLFGLSGELPEKPALTVCFKSGECQSVMTELKDMRQ